MRDFATSRKKLIMIVASILLLLFGAIVLGMGISSEDEDKSDDRMIKAPILSQASGFYDDEFKLAISADDSCTIYYTTDGSDPTENSNVYDGEITISDATRNPNTYSMRQDVSVGFDEDFINKFKGDEAPIHVGYKSPDYNIDKCNVIKCVAINSLGQSSRISTGIYFVGKTAADYDNSNVLCITTDPDNLFDYEKGIYVKGKIFDDYIKTDAINNFHHYRWRYWNANYQQRGSDWERPANLEFFAKDGSEIIAMDAGIRIHGGCSRGINPKSLKLFARGKYGAKSFGDDLYDDGYVPESLILSCGGSEPVVQVCDYMMASMVSDLDFATMKFQPYVLFLNGEYWGFYWLETRYDSKYCAKYYGVDEDEVLIIKEGEVSAGDDLCKDLYTSMKETITEGDMSIAANYDKACELIDMDSYLDYYATQIFIARSSDWPVKNYALWRTVHKDDSDYADGKWRWMLFDSDSQALKASLVNDDTLSYVIKSDKMFASLWDNETFRNDFKDRILKVADNNFSKDKVDAMFEKLEADMTPRMAKSWARFYGSDNNKLEYFQGKLDSYHQFLLNRKSVVEGWFE